VERLGEFHVAEGMTMPAPDVLGVGLDALCRQPVANLEVADDQRTGAFGDAHRIADVVAMAVADQDELSGTLLALVLAAGFPLKNGSTRTS